LLHYYYSILEEEQFLLDTIQEATGDDMDEDEMVSFIMTVRESNDYFDVSAFDYSEME